MTDPISLFPDASVNPVSDRSNMICEEAFYFCSLRVQLWEHQVQHNKVGLSEVLKSSMFREMSIVVFSGTGVRYLSVGLNGG